MEKSRIFLVLLISFILVFGIYIINAAITGMFIGFGSPQNAEWWNISWHYRVRLEINSTQYSRTDWPIEHHMNFTELLPSGTFDINSARVFEYSPSGTVLYEVPSQFEQDENFDAANNAVGTMVFLMNGTVSSNTNRTFYVYYDSIENGAKQNQNYPISVNYSWDGEVIQVNSSFLKFYIDTLRGENTSGLYHVEDKYENVVFSEVSNSRTTEYSEYSNGTTSFSFDLRNNATFINGTVRLIIEQMGDEIIFGYPNQKTNEASIVKRYYIYSNAGPQSKGSFIKISQKITNNAGYSINRNSTPAGSLALDVNRTFNSGRTYSEDSNTTNPYSWARASGGTLAANELVGIVNLYQNGTSNYFAASATAYGRVGLHLGSTDIGAASSIEQSSIVYFAGSGGAEAVTEFESIRDRVKTPEKITQYLPEVWFVANEPSTNQTIYNRNETILIVGNITQGDPYNLTVYMNATLDMGTLSEADDQTVILYDDGNHGDWTSNDKIYANSYQIPNYGNVSLWTINFTTYYSNSEFLNSTTYTFNVTDALNVSVNVTNPIGLIERTVFASLYVRNYRNDAFISGALINCSYGSGQIVNKTDWMNGTYSVNFTAPSAEGDFNLTCNATINNNFGNNSDEFVTEPGKINVSITSQPSQISLSNITLYGGENFVTTSNATNLGNGTAYDSNISMELLGGWGADNTTQFCDNINKNSFCARPFSVTVPNNTVPGNYYLNVSVNWTNPDGTMGTNKTSLNITINSNPQINVSQTSLTGEGGDGAKVYVGNFTVLSIGNDALQNITFSCYSGPVCTDFVLNFTPANVSSLNVNSNYSVAVNVTVPLGYGVGVYGGVVNVSAGNDNYKNLTLNISVAPKTNVSISLNPSNYSSMNITKFNNESFIFVSNASNMANGSAKYVNVSLLLPPNISSNSSLAQCNNLTKSQNCVRAFNITILNGTVPGNYYLNVSVNWTNPDGTMGNNQSTLSIAVFSNPLINITQTLLSQTVGDGAKVYVGNFTVLSIGNDALQNITFSCYSGPVCTDFVLNFTPANVSSLNVNSNYSVAVNVTVPLGYGVGVYGGVVNVSAGNDNYKNLTLNISVPSNRSWTMVPISCDRSENPDEGTVCEVMVRNIGNDMINFTITPENGNYTKVNETTFYMTKWTNHTFNVTYNVTGVSQAVYNSLFIVDADQTNANPPMMILNITLYPYLPPLINFTINPSTAEQNSSVFIIANVTDRGGSGIKEVNVSVKTPSGATNQTAMNFVNVSGNLSRWNFTYPGGLGSTSSRGLYNVTINAADNIGNTENMTKNFSIYSNISVISTTLSNTYLQGDTGSIYYIARNNSGIGLNGINVTFSLRNSNNNVTYSSTGQTNSEGTIYPLPSFVLSSDAPTGNYTLFTNSTYFDEIVNQSIFIQKNSTLQVNARTITVTGLFADIETSVSWYPNNIMRFGILVYNGEGRPVDPDNMNLTVYDPANNVYFVANMSQMTKQAVGYYIYSHAMGAGTPIGMFLAVINVTQGTFNTMKLKAFRVSQGGPYDVRVRLFENEVPQGDYLDFELIVENKGEVSQDVFVEYRVVSATGNTTYYTASEAILTPAFSNQSFTRTAFIYSDQPLGNYLLNARVTYSVVEPAIYANTSFVVTSAGGIIFPPAPTPPPPIYVYGPVGGFITTYPPAPTEKISASITITKHNTNISLSRGMKRIESVTVKNNGITNLTDVSLFIIGIPTTWFKIVPEKYSQIVPDDSTVFLVEFDIPKNAIVDEYDATFIASSGVVTDQKSTKIKVFESIEELIREQIRALKRNMEDLRIDVKLAERDGKDVSNVMLIVNETENQIYGAEDDLYNNKTESAMDKVQNAINLIKKARDLLDSLRVVKAPEVPIMTIFIVVIAIAGIAVLMLYLWKKKKLERVRPYVIPLGKLVESVKGGVKRGEISKEKLSDEKEKVNRMLTALEKERTQGIISASTYEKMKKSLEDKLRDIEKK